VNGRRDDLRQAGRPGPSAPARGALASPCSKPTRSRRRLPRPNTRGSDASAPEANADLGLVVFTASTALHCARLNLLVGDLPTAEEELRRAYDALARSEETYLLPPITELLGQVLDAQGRVHEAEEIGQAAEGLAASDAVEPQALWPSLCGTALAWQERADEAEWRAHEALDRVRIGAALTRLSSWYARSASGDGDRRASDRGAGPAAEALFRPPGLTREGFLREILVNEKLPDGYARELALGMLDLPEELFAEMMASRNG
jgi:hypothetical protein